jgi:hypothetical protein
MMMKMKTLMIFLFFFSMHHEPMNEILNKCPTEYTTGKSDQLECPMLIYKEEKCCSRWHCYYSKEQKANTRWHWFVGQFIIAE